MKQINFYFFGEERITLEDALYFYGSQFAIVGLIVFTAISIY